MPSRELSKPPAVLVYLSMGSNLGDREGNLAKAAYCLSRDIRVTRLSPIYETAPWGYQSQSDFLNQVLEGETTFSPEDLLEYLKRIEKQMGRTPGIRYGPRIIDLDILFYDEITLDSPGLTIPHAALPDRAFVLVPMADLAPDLVHPTLGKTIRQILAGLGSNGVRPYTPNGTIK